MTVKYGQVIDNQLCRLKHSSEGSSFHYVICHRLYLLSFSANSESAHRRSFLTSTRWMVLG